jgi:hypothetical protein
MTTKDQRFNILILVPRYGVMFATIEEGLYMIFIQISKVAFYYLV